MLSTDASLIEQHILHFYSQLFSSNAVNAAQDFSLVHEVIPSLVTEEDNHRLLHLPSSEEIRVVVNDMDGSSAPGPDGFSGIFFQKCWSIVGPDVCQAVQYFFRTGSAWYKFKPYGAYSQEIKEAITIDKYRPIVLGNFIFKEIKKILANRLGIIAARILSPAQFGFVQGRHISDCISV